MGDRHPFPGRPRYGDRPEQPRIQARSINEGWRRREDGIGRDDTARRTGDEVQAHSSTQRGERGPDQSRGARVGLADSARLNASRKPLYREAAVSNEVTKASAQEIESISKARITRRSSGTTATSRARKSW